MVMLGQQGDEPGLRQDVHHLHVLDVVRLMNKEKKIFSWISKET